MMIALSYRVTDRIPPAKKMAPDLDFGANSDRFGSYAFDWPGGLTLFSLSLCKKSIFLICYGYAL